MAEEILIYLKNKHEWREWLAKNHLKESKVRLIKYKKHTKQPTLTNIEAMHEAICFGWIDTTVKKIDDNRYSQCFVRRNNKSRWSLNTLSYAKQLIKEGRMMPLGLKYYKEGLKKPVIDHNIPKNAPIPLALKKELIKNNLFDEFIKLAPSYRRMHIVWLSRAKMPETKLKRIKLIIQDVSKKKKPKEMKDAKY